MFSFREFFKDTTAGKYFLSEYAFQMHGSQDSIHIYLSGK
jgi:hypothetical protein